ncbi:SHOCT domain-containing protein [Candidatus Parcubacteria bacterium]|nr:MAG: SHOCT domain-containing protein [Candidatus Parcubacteria bacterium]
MGGGFGSGFGTFGLVGGLIGLLVNIGILVGIVLLIVWAVKQFSPSTPAPPTGNTTMPAAPRSAREILDLRYAKGELSREEYLTMIQDLS